MKTIRHKAVLASTAALAWAVAVAPPLGAAPASEAQGGASVPMNHSSMDHSTGAAAMPGMMQHQCDMGMMRMAGGADMMQHGGNTDMMQHHQEMMAKMHSRGGMPSLSGQDAFGAIGEIVALLEADPKTDWTKVDLEALRAHLIDMNEVTLNATATPKAVEGGIQIAVTGTGRTVAAIQRMVPMHAAEIDGHKGWSAKTSTLPDGVLLTVTTNDPKEVLHIRGLGFAGVMVTGSHHQAHHFAIAKGEPMHSAAAHAVHR